ncbi:MAG: hypothetical protein JWN14_4742 [Chthonomonadales bacterium]|nr:hypothetical protein [Chthonomonadales bacterium]
MKNSLWTVAGTGVLLVALALITPHSAQGQTSPQLDRVSSAPLTEPEIVPGKPPLTETMVARYTDFLGWIFEISLDAPQRRKMRDFLVGYWKRGDNQQMLEVTNTLEMERQSMAVPASSRRLLRERVFPDILKQARQQTSDKETQWVLGLYDAANKPLAPGSPPLSRAVVAACAEVACFMVSEAQGRPVEATQALKEEATKLLARSYPRLSAAEQEQFAQLPLLWATLQATWPQIPEAERAALRTKWRADLGATAPAPATPLQNAPRTAPIPSSGYSTTSVMRSMMSSHSSIMRSMRR